MADSKHLEPTLTLSLGGVEFSLNPEKNDPGSVDFRREGDEIMLKLSSFSGTLRVAQSTTSTSPKVGREKDTSIPNDIPPKPVSEKAAVVDATPKITHVSAKAVEAPLEQSLCQKRSLDNGEVASPEPYKKARESSLEEDVFVDTEASQPTLLGQPDFSQTQPSLTDHDNTSETAIMDSQTQNETSKAQQILESSSSAVDDKGNDEEELSVKSNHSPSLSLESKEETTVPARVSLGSPVAPKGQDPPRPRWGHTMTPVGSNRILIYGGQTFDSESGLPKTLNDLYIFDTSNQRWFKPFNCDGMPRQWHTATFLPERQLLISFGGEAANPKTGKVKTTDQVMVLDTEIMLWYPPSVSGNIPSGRSGHTATILPKTNELVVFGGVKGSKWLNTVSVLDTMRWKWSSPKIQGSAPKPRSYHSATTVKGNRVVFFGGNNAESSFNTVHVLETDADKWRWTHPKVMGYGPCARTGHSATLLADQKTVCIYGGWDPNGDDDSGKDDADMIFEDCFLLDTEKWVWKKGPKPAYARLSERAQGADGGTKRVGHTAVLREEKGSEVLVFGGRVPGDTFTGDFQSLTVPSKTAKMK